jgi:hypothetical protein
MPHRRSAEGRRCGDWGSRSLTGTRECPYAPVAVMLVSLLATLLTDRLLRRSFRAGGQPARVQVGGRSHCPWATAGDRSFPPVLAWMWHGCSGYPASTNHEMVEATAQGDGLYHGSSRVSPRPLFTYSVHKPRGCSSFFGYLVTHGYTATVRDTRR